MRIQTKQDCERQNRRWRLLNQDLLDVIGEKNAKVAELVIARQWVDRWRGRALASEAAHKRTADAMRDAHQKLLKENAELRAELAKTREDDGDCDD